MINGIVIIDKEPGYTSHDVVAKLRGILGQKKIGHTGTLDPAATGVLPVCLGNATGVCGMLTDCDKEYEAELLLGVETDTQDTTGKVLDRRQVCVSEETVRETCAGFVGEYDQIPPMYSALKVNGKKLYELARQGKEVERTPRRVRIHSLIIETCRLPVVKMRVVCSRGTYIRTLCFDIGRKLGCGGTMSSLRRTAVGKFTVEDALRLDQVKQLWEEGALYRVLRPVDSVFEDCPSLRVREEFGILLENGNPIAPEQTVQQDRPEPGRQVRFYRADGSFAGIYAYRADRGKYMPVKMFLSR